MTKPERQKKIDLYGKAYELLTDALKKFPRAMWQFKPALERWSIHELVIHIADSEANSFARARKFIVEPGATVMAYDEARWARGLNYHAQSTDDALELFRWLRGNTHKLIRALPVAIWAHMVYHPENGVMTMDAWLDVYARHIPEHIAQMEKVYAEWKQTHR